MIERISGIYKRMSHAAMRAGRDPSEVTLIAVSKGVGAEAIKEAHEAGLRVFGESRVQEALKKNSELGPLTDGIRWHMIGRLQKNKTRAAVGLFELIHSLDSIALAEQIDRHAGGFGKVQRCLIEVKLSTEESKSGVDEKGIGALIRAIRGMENIKLEGLMAIPPYTENPEDSRPYYRRLRGLGEEHDLKELSMGMTGDFEVAIEEGSTMVRVGTAIFGLRGGAG